jgi:UPF0042 nucleotide-binding protein
LVDVGGVGVLLAGPSGAGKSECALELISRGNRLVADDAVELSREGDRVIGRASEAIGPHLEIRGLGILCVTDLYGPGAYAESVAVDLVCRLDPGRTDFDRTGRDDRRRGRARPAAATRGHELRRALRGAMAAREAPVVSRARVVFVSGLSGSGKSTAMAALEDLGFYCADNLPAPLVEQFLDLCTKATPPIEKIALALDAREAQFLTGMPAAIARVREEGYSVELIFLDSSEQALVRRYRETRRVHPLSPDGSVERGITAERLALRDVVQIADRVIDTSQLNVHQLKAAIVSGVSGQTRPTVVNVISFGFRYGTPEALELLFDVRFLPNPYFEVGLREQTGRDAPVAEYVLKATRGAAFFERLRDWLRFLLPLYDSEGKAYVTIGVGCTGGRHRSVVVAEALASTLRADGREVNVEHRDVEKST